MITKIFKIAYHDSNRKETIVIESLGEKNQKQIYAIQKSIHLQRKEKYAVSHMRSKVLEFIIRSAELEFLLATI